MQTTPYLERIQYSGTTQPDLTTLQQLQAQHLLHVPFENLDIHYGRPIQLDTAAFYTKVVHDHRGGFCYELNGLFQTLLHQLGFDTQLLSASMYQASSQTFGPEYDHVAILVTLNDRAYLVDVGAGEFAFHPLLLEAGRIQEDPRGLFSLERSGDYWMVYQHRNDAPQIEYRFTTQARLLRDFQEMCTYHQTAPTSHFTQQKLITRPTPDGRITLTDRRLKITEQGQSTHIKEFPADAYADQLNTWFGLEERQLLLHHSTDH